MLPFYRLSPSPLPWKHPLVSLTQDLPLQVGKGRCSQLPVTSGPQFSVSAPSFISYLPSLSFLGIPPPLLPLLLARALLIGLFHLRGTGLGPSLRPPWPTLSWVGMDGVWVGKDSVAQRRGQKLLSLWVPVPLTRRETWRLSLHLSELVSSAGSSAAACVKGLSRL